MSKVTIKHFLNTNLKPYIVRGEKYYTPYILITVTRKTTKVKSHAFKEMHTESDFEEFLEKGSEYYKELIDEAATIENIIVTQLEFDGREFDTHLFSALYNLMPKYYLVDSKSFEKSITKNLQGKISVYELILKNQRGSGLSFYEWFRPSVQAKLKRLTKLSALDEGLVKRLNLTVLISFFEFLGIICKSNRKYEDLIPHYQIVFDHFAQSAIDILKK